MTPLEVALGAALDPSISTEALRIYLGIAETVERRLKRDDHICYMSLAEVNLLSGVDPATIGKHLPDLARLGIIKIVGGAKGREMDGHGIAACWDTCLSDIKPVDLSQFIGQPLARAGLMEQTYFGDKHMTGIGKYLNPGGYNWLQKTGASSGWRTAMVLIATHGLTRATVSTVELGTVLGVHRNNAGRSLARLDTASKDGRSWVWDPWFLVHDIENDGAFLIDDRAERMQRHQNRTTWLVHRAEWVKAKTAESEAGALINEVDSPVFERQPEEPAPETHFMFRH